MLQQQQTATGPKDAPQLGETRAWMRHLAEDQGRHGPVERLVPERERLDIRRDKPHRPRVLLAPCRPEHPEREVRGDNVRALGVKREVDSRSRADLEPQAGSGSFPPKVRTPSAKTAALKGRHEPVIDRSKKAGTKL